MPSLARLSRTSSQATMVAPPPVEKPNMKRRKSSVPSFKNISLPFRSRRRDSDLAAIHAEHVGNNLLSLPTELQLQVLQYLSFTDLCSLRAVSSESNRFITGPNSAIARYWIASRLHQVHRLYPAPPKNHWQHLTSHMHRWSVARHLAEMIAYHIQYTTLLYVHNRASHNGLSVSMLSALLLPEVYTIKTNKHAVLKNIRVRPVALRIRRRLTPLLFIISHYLSSCQEALSNSQIAYSLPGEPTTFWTCTESAERFSCYTRDQLFAAHYCWLFLEWILNTLLSRPSYAGSIERAVRGWRALPLDRESLFQVLVHGNLTAVKQLLVLKDYGERKKWAKTFIRSLDPEENGFSWSSAWEALDMRHGDVPIKAQATAILRGPGKGDSLWTGGAKGRLSSQGIELEDNELHGNASTTMRFLTDLAGFDLFHQAPPEDLQEDEDSEMEIEQDTNEDDNDLSIPDDRQQVIDELLEEEEQAEGGGNYWDV